MVCGSRLITVAIAALVTLTTRVTGDARCLPATAPPAAPVRRRSGPVGLVLALTIRCIPLLVNIVREVSEARKSARARVLAPVDGRTGGGAGVAGRHTRWGDALIARGVDD